MLICCIGFMPKLSGMHEEEQEILKIITENFIIFAI